MKQEKKWNRTLEKVGHLPTFAIKCEFCDKDMFLRGSQICYHPISIKMTWYRKVIAWIANRMTMAVFPSGHGTLECNDIEYKCVLCGNTVVFAVQDDAEYLQELLDRRKGVPLYYPPKEEWASISEIHKQKLESLGYL